MDATRSQYVEVLIVHSRSMSVERDIRFDLIARLCPNTTGAELRSVATEVSKEFIGPGFILTWFFRRVCLLYVRGGRWQQRETFWTLSKRSCVKEQNFPRRGYFFLVHSDGV